MPTTLPEGNADQGAGVGETAHAGLGEGPDRCRANFAYLRQSRPDSGIGFQAKVIQII